MSQFHDASQCRGEVCCLHNPSNHHMRDWPLHWRSDRGLMERICPCGVGHPDPDHMAYQQRHGNTDDGTHGCCGCCQPHQDEIRRADTPAASPALPEGWTVGDGEDGDFFEHVGADQMDHQEPLVWIYSNRVNAYHCPLADLAQIVAYLQARQEEES